MNRKLQFWGIALMVLALNLPGAHGQAYEFAVVSNSETAGLTFSAVANNSGNTFVCVGGTNSLVVAVNANNFGSFAATNSGGGYLLSSVAWTNTVHSPNKDFSLFCVAPQPNGFIASGVSNTVFVSNDGISWTNWGGVLAPQYSSINVDGIAYNPTAGYFAAALAIYEVWRTPNPISKNVVWQQSTVNGASFAESFTAVTSFAGDNMALCGIFGDIRVSSDGGNSWTAKQKANLNAPSLLTINSDSVSNLVCAGDQSTIEVSLNGGAAWNYQSNIKINNSEAGSPTNFNAIAYSSTTTNFIAAGANGTNGLIVVAPKMPGTNNWTWVSQTNIWSARNGTLTTTNASLDGLTLYGASFATNGLFQGVAMLAGNNGTVVVGGLPPPAPGNPNPSNTGLTNVLSSSQTSQSIVAIVSGGPSNPTNYIAVDWYSAQTGGTLLADNTNLYQPTIEVCGMVTNWAQERDLRTGFTSSRTPFVFTVIPGAPINPVSETNCAGNGQFGMCSNVPLLVTVDSPVGQTNEVNWYDANSNFVATTRLTPGSDLFSYTPTNDEPGVYTYYAQTTNLPTRFVSTNWTAVTFQVNPLPQWTNTPEFYTNTLTLNQVDPTLTVFPGITNLSPGDVVLVDWYTSSDPNVATYNNPNAPLAYGGVATLGSFIPTNANCGIYTYYARARVVDPSINSGCWCQTPNLVPVTFVLMPPAPTNAVIGVTNVLGTPYIPVWVDLLVNADNPAANFAVDWYTSAQGSNSLNYLNNGGDFNVGNQFFHVPTNQTCGVDTIWAETKAVNTPPSGHALVSASRTAVTFVVIPAAPASPVNETNCANILAPNPLVATVPNTQTINWYNVQFGGIPLTNGAAFFPTDTSPGVYVYWAEAQDNLTGFVSTNRTQVVLQVNPLPLAPDAIGETNVLTVPDQTNSALTMSVASSIFIGTNVTVDWYTDSGGVTNAYTATNAADPKWTTGGGVIEATNTLVFIPTNRVCGTYTYYGRARVINSATCSCLDCVSTDLTAVTFVLLPPAPTNAVVGLTNILNAISQTNDPIWVNLLTNRDNTASTFQVNWYSTPQGSNSVNYLNNGSETNLHNRFFHTPTDATCNVYTNWAETMALNSSLVSPTRTPVVYVIIPAAPIPVFVTQTNYQGTTDTPFQVSVATNQTAYWYSSSNTLPANLLSIGTNFDPGTSLPGGVWRYYAQAVDTNVQLGSTDTVQATFTLLSTTPSVRVGSTNISVQWFGKGTLQSTTNLVSPVWIKALTGAMSTNTVNRSITNPPAEFFRLTN
jgi:hypothetical protein